MEIDLNYITLSGYQFYILIEKFKPCTVQFKLQDLEWKPDLKFHGHSLCQAASWRTQIQETRADWALDRNAASKQTC